VKSLEELELTSTDINAVAPKVIMDIVEKEARAKRVARQLFRINRDLVGAKGRSIHVPKRGALVAYSVSEGQAIPESELAYSTVEITPAKVGVRATITQEAIDGTELDVIRDSIEEAGEALANKEDTELLNKLLTFTNWENVSVAPETTGTLSYNDAVKARTKVLVAKYQPNTLVVHPDEEADLLKDAKFIDASQYGAREPILNGEIGKFAGLKVLVTQNMPAGKAIVMDTTRTAWMAIKRDLQLKRFDNAEKDRVELNFFMEFGAEVVNTGAIAIITVV